MIGRTNRHSAATCKSRSGNKRARPSAIGGYALQALEQRLLLSTVTFTNVAGGDWGTRGNWSGNALPGPGDIAVINLTNGAHVTIDSAATAGTLDASSPLDIIGGSLTFGTAQITSALTLSAGVLIQNAGGQMTIGASGSFAVDGGTLQGLTINGNGVAFPQANEFVTITGGLTLAGTAYLEPGATLNFIGAQTLGGTGTLLLDSNLAAPYGDFSSIQLSGNLTISPTFTIAGEGCDIENAGTAASTLYNQGTIYAQTTSTSDQSIFFGVDVVNSGYIDAQSSGIYFNNLLEARGASLGAAPFEYVDVEGSLTGNTAAFATFSGTLLLDGSGTASSPQLLETMSKDGGAYSTGTDVANCYKSIDVSGGDYVQLADQSNNSGTGAAEAVYADSLTVESGATLDLNGLHLYCASAEIDGSVIGGTISLVAGGFHIQPNSIDYSSIAPGITDSWSVQTDGGAMIVDVNPTSQGTTAALNPALRDATVEVLNGSGVIIASGMTSGKELLMNIPASSAGATLTVHVSASAPSGMGGYSIGVDDANLHTYTLATNVQTTGFMPTPLNTDDYQFTATAGQQAQLMIQSPPYNDDAYTLVAPDGSDLLSNLQQSSSAVTLPATGAYNLYVYANGGQPGPYSFTLAAGALPLTAVLAGPPGSILQTSIPSATITFNYPVSGFDLSDFTLSLNGGPNLLTSAQTLTSNGNGTTYTLGNLAALTLALGQYTLTLTAAGSGIIGNGQALASNASIAWADNRYDLNGALSMRLESDHNTIDIWDNATEQGAPDSHLTLSLLNAIQGISFVGAGGRDSLSVDFSNGDPLPANASFDGAGGINTLTLIGTTASDSVSATAGNVYFTNTSGIAQFISVANVQALDFPGGSGGADVLNIDGGAWIINADTPESISASPNMTVNLSGSSTSAVFESSQHLAALNVVDGAFGQLASVTAVTGAARTPANHYLLVTDALKIDSTSRFDLVDNDMIIHTGSHASGESALPTIEQYLLEGSDAPAGTYVTGVDWNGPDGLISLAATARFSAYGHEVTALAYAANDDMVLGAFPTFDGETTQPGDIIIKYTYVGDAALDGAVDTASVNMLAGQYGNSGGSWDTAAFEFDGVTNSDSVNLIAGAYGEGLPGNTQYPPL